MAEFGRIWQVACPSTVTAILGVGAEVSAEVDVKDDITITSIRFKLAVELNIYLKLIEKVLYY